MAESEGEREEGERAAGKGETPKPPPPPLQLMDLTLHEDFYRPELLQQEEEIFELDGRPPRRRVAKFPPFALKTLQFI